MSFACRIVLWIGLTLATGTCIAADLVPITLQSSTNTVARYGKIEFTLQVPASFANPFDPDEVAVDLELTTPQGRRLSLPAFWCQDYQRRRVEGRDWLYPAGLPGWKARYAPGDIGPYQAVARITTRAGSSTSAPVRFESRAGSSQGFLRVSPKDPRFLEFSEGRPFFAIGQNLAFIGSQQYVTLARAEEIFATLAANGANYLRVWTCCEDWALAIEARKSAWGRSWDWRPPTAPIPGQPDTNRLCLKLSPSRPTLALNPSHPLALRPGTRYVLSGQVLTESNAALRLECQGKTSPLSASPDWGPFRHEFQTGPSTHWLGAPQFALAGGGAAYLRDLSLREAAGGPELLWEADLNRPPRGYYNPLDSFMLDELLAAAQARGLYLQLCLLTRDLYMSALADPAGAPYSRAIAQARKLFRYAIARWGYSTSVAAWEYWNEMDPGLPTDRFYAELGDYLEQADVYRHLRTTSTWGPSPKDCRHPKLDLADTHFYLRPSDRNRLRDEVEAVLDRTSWLRAQAPNKPIHLGEFGLANERWQLTPEMKSSKEIIDIHNALWASALSGAAGTALFWWWERLDQRDAYPFYRPLSAFLADVPWTSGHVQPASLQLADERLRCAGLQAQNRAWLWLFHRDAAWAALALEKRVPAQIQPAEVRVQNLPPGPYRIQWSDTTTGAVAREDRQTAQPDGLRLVPPPFARDLACKIIFNPSP